MCPECLSLYIDFGINQNCWVLWTKLLFSATKIVEKRMLVQRREPSIQSGFYFLKNAMVIIIGLAEVDGNSNLT